MTDKQLNEAKNFKFQMKICAIMCTISSLIIGYSVLKHNITDNTWLIIPFGAIVFSIIYFNMRSMIAKYEKLTK